MFTIPTFCMEKYSDIYKKKSTMQCEDVFLINEKSVDIQLFLILIHSLLLEPSTSITCILSSKVIALKTLQY